MQFLEKSTTSQNTPTQTRQECQVVQYHDIYLHFYDQIIADN